MDTKVGSVRVVACWSVISVPRLVDVKLHLQVSRRLSVVSSTLGLLSDFRNLSH